jgi:hypothetical protein
VLITDVAVGSSSEIEVPTAKIRKKCKQKERKETLSCISNKGLKTYWILIQTKAHSNTVEDCKT